MKWLLLPILIGLNSICFAGSSSSRFIDAIGSNDAYDSKAQAGLFMLHLWNQGYAGRDTGLCVDYSEQDGSPSFKVGMSTSAFTTGTDQLRNTDFQSAALNRLITAIAANKKAPVNMTISGYADPQHYRVGSDYTVEKSIEMNQALSQRRAETISSLFQSNPNVQVTQVVGIPSPVLELARPAQNDGLRCDVRRKVVLSIDAPLPEVQSTVNGIVNRAPSSMSRATKDQLFTKLSMSVIRKLGQMKRDPDFKRGDLQQWTQTVYDDLKANGVLSEECERSPLKEITMAVLETKVEFWARRQNLIRRGKFVSQDKRVQEALRAQGYSVAPSLAGADPALLIGCVKDDSIYGTLKKNDPENFEVSGASYLGKLKPTNGKVKVGFDPQGMKDQNHHHVRPVGMGPMPAREQKQFGFYCDACKKGVFFDEKPGGFQARLDDRVIERRSGQADTRHMNTLNAVSAKEPFTAASFMKPRMYIVKDCQDCRCDSQSRIQQNENVLSIDPLADGSQATFSHELDVAEFKKACIIRPPVMHTCGVAPNDPKEKNFDPYFEEKRTIHYFDNAVQAVNDLNRAAKMGNQCSEPKLLSPEQKIQDVLCSGGTHPERRLPSSDERKDCL